MRIRGLLFIYLLFAVVFGISCDREIIRSGFPFVVTVSAEDSENAVVFTGQLQKYEKEIDEAGFIWQCDADPLPSPGFKIPVTDPGLEQLRAEATFSFSSEHNYSVRAYARCGETMIYGERIDFQTNLILPCQLLRIEPESAYRGDTIKLFGKGFNMILYYNRVLIEGRNSLIIGGNDTVLTCIVPLQTTKGNKPVKIVVNGIEKDFGPRFTLLLPPPPLVVTGQTANVTALTATLSGTVNPNNLPSTVIFEYGLTSAYGKSITATPGTVNGSVDINVSAFLNQLLPCTTYHYRIKAISESGTVVGDDFSFTTPELPPEPYIQSLSASNVKYGETLNITGNNFSLVNQVLLGSPSQYITVNPNTSSDNDIEIEVYNHQNPTQLLGFSVFRIGLVYAGGTKWSDQVTITSSWTRMADLPAPERYKAGYFSLGGQIYLGCGASYGTTLRDFWRYDPLSNIWTQLADFPGVPRVYAMGTADNSFGYMGTGHTADNSSRIQLYDFYKYNPGSNVWSTLPDYPDPINNFFLNYSISVNGYAYVSLSNVVQNTREIVNDSWVSHPNVSDLMNSGGNSVFVFGNSYYVISGYRFGTMVINNAVWEYNTLTSNWVRKADFPGPARNLAIYFTIGEYGYMGCGTTPADQQFTDMWRYDPSNDSWIRIEDFPGGARSHAVCASIGDYGFAGMGVKLSFTNYYKDFWRFDPKAN